MRKIGASSGFLIGMGLGLVSLVLWFVLPAGLVFLLTLMAGVLIIGWFGWQGDPERKRRDRRVQRDWNQVS